MYYARFSLLLLLSYCTALTAAPALQLDQPLPAFTIEDRGELTLDNDQFDYRSWNSQQSPGKVHVIQYLAGTKSASKLFEPFTDRIQQEFELENYHVTTIINLDAAMWGTAGFVVSEVKASKRKYPDSTIVLDEDGVGAKRWGLDKKGAGLVITDSSGALVYFKQKPLTEEEMTAVIDIMRNLIDS